MKKARWILPVLAALFLVPCAGATERVVASDGTTFTVDVVLVHGEDSPDATALSFSILHPGGSTETGTVSLTGDSWGDREPALVLSPGISGPFLVWTRNDGLHDQIAYSRFEGGAWSQPRYLTSGARDHVSPQVGVDAHGTGIVAWVETGGSGRVMFGIFDPSSGNLLASPRDLLHELILRSPPASLGSSSGSRPIGRPAADSGPWPAPEGGNDTPAIPPCTNNNTVNCKGSSSAVVVTSPGCPRVTAAVVRNNALSIGLLESGMVLGSYRSVIPAGAPAGYTTMLLRTILEENCQE